MKKIAFLTLLLVSFIMVGLILRDSIKANLQKAKAKEYSDNQKKKPWGRKMF